MTTRIQKEFHFSASHQLKHLAEMGQVDHPCARMHGHNYIVVFVLEGFPDRETGFIRDYRDLDIVKKWIDNEIDHRHLNEVIAGGESGLGTTAENLAKFMFRKWILLLPELVEVRISETPKTWACYNER